MLSRTVGLVPFQPHSEDVVDACCRTFSVIYVAGLKKKNKEVYQLGSGRC